MPTLPEGSLSLPTIAAFVLHIGAGTVALFVGVVALSSAKGGRLHIGAGRIFVVAMLLMAVAADYLAVVRRDQLPNLLIGTFTFYLITTAWLTVHRSDGQYGLAEKLALAVVLTLFLPFALLSLQLATGMRPFLRFSVGFEGPILVAIYIFTLLTGIAVATDLKVLIARGIAGRARIERHLWRMCLGLALASGSAFTNGFSRLLPKGVIPFGWYFVPQFLMLGVLFFWLMRVRYTRWYYGDGKTGDELIVEGELSSAATD
jgi:uncharacterized membrane protein